MFAPVLVVVLLLVARRVDASWAPWLALARMDRKDGGGGCFVCSEKILPSFSGGVMVGGGGGGGCLVAVVVL